MSNKNLLLLWLQTFKDKQKISSMQKVFFLIACFLLTISHLVNGQNSIDWQKVYGGTMGEYGYAIKQTKDGGYIIAGSTYSNDGDVTGFKGYVDFWVVKINSTGDKEWTKCLGNSCGQEAKSIEQTLDGGYIVAGYTFSCNEGQVTGTHGGNDYWIAKLSNTGDLQWQKSLGGSSGDKANSVKQTSDGGYIVVGTSSSNNGDVSNNHGFPGGAFFNTDAWIVKLNSSGSITWQKCLGGNLAEAGNAVIQTADGGYIVAGSATSADGDVSVNNGSEDFWIVKLGSLGTVQWEKALGGSGRDVATAIKQTFDGGYVVTGFSSSNDGDVIGLHGNEDYWVVKLNNAGDSVEWKKCFGGTGQEHATSIHQTPDKGYIISGFSNSTNGNVSDNHGYSDYWIVKTDSTGTMQLTKSFGGTNVDESEASDLTTDNGLILAGRSASSDGDVDKTNVTGFNIWVVKLVGKLLAIVTTTVTQNITGNTPIEVNDGIYKLVELTPKGNPPTELNGDVKTTVTINSTVSNLRGHPFVRRHYDIEPAVNPTTAEATVTIYFTQLDFDHFNAYLQANPQLPFHLLPTGGVDNGYVRITQFHGTFSGTSDPANYPGDAHTFIPTSVVWNNASNWWEVTFPVTGFSGFYLTTNETSLPLSLLSFDGVVKEASVDLHWLTSNEINTKEFIVERAKANNPFYGIGKLNAQSSAGVHHYSFTDKQPLEGLSLYRLLMKDKDGSFTYSKIVSINNNTVIASITVNPNPIKAKTINIKFTNKPKSTYLVILYNNLGQEMLKRTIRHAGGSFTQIINLNSTLIKGVYQMQISNGESKVSQQIIVE